MLKSKFFLFVALIVACACGVIYTDTGARIFYSGLEYVQTGIDYVYEKFSSGDSSTKTIDEMTEEEKKIFENWVNNKPVYEEALRKIEELFLSGLLNSGYEYNKKSYHVMKTKFKKAQKFIQQDKPLETDKAINALNDSMKEFTASLRWVSGRRHVKYPHISSGENEGEWIPDKGYHFVDVNKSLEVEYVGLPYRCDTCRGQKMVVKQELCTKCNGTGKVETAFDAIITLMDKGVKIVEGLDGIICAFSGEKPPPVRRNNTGPSYSPCTHCNRRGTVPQWKLCSDCNGRGVIYR